MRTFIKSYQYRFIFTWQSLTPVYYVRFITCLIIGIFSITGISLQGQQPINLSRYDDDTKILAADSVHKYTLFPGAKNICLFKSISSLVNFGGEIREQVLYFNHENWDATPLCAMAVRTDNPFLLERYMMHSNIVFKSHLRVYTELKSNFENGRTSGLRPQVDIDKLDLHQFFADINIVSNSSSGLSIRAGRQEYAYGASREISENEGPNVRLAFQGYKLMIGISSFAKIDAFYFQPVDNMQGLFDDPRNKNKRLYGMYSTFELPDKSNCLLDFYFFAKF